MREQCCPKSATATSPPLLPSQNKHLLAIPDETDFGQLVASVGNGGLAETTASAPQRTELHHSGGGQPPEEVDLSTRRPPATPLKGPRHTTSLVAKLEQQGSHRGQSRAINVVPVQHDGRQSKFDDNAEYNRAFAAGASEQVGASDLYEAMSTESTPSQVRAEGVYFQANNPSYIAGHLQVHGQAAAQRHHPATRRHLNNKTHSSDDTQPHHVDHSSGDSVDLIDDIHTTRSSLAANEGNSYASNPSAVVPTPQQDQMPITPSLSHHGPYGATPSSMNSLGQLLVHNANSAKLVEPFNSIDIDDMMTSYSRFPTNGSVNDSPPKDNSSQQQQFLGSFMLANLLGSAPTRGSDNAGQAEQHSGQMQQHSSAQHSNRALVNASPMSVVLNDMFKLLRSQQMSPANSPPGGEHSAGSSRLQHSILQQLRSMPVSLATLLQALSPSNSGSDLNLMNHDASESSQHYQSVSMLPTDIHSTITRSLRGSAVLPAFPAPKGAPQPWVPPTSGGNPSFHAALNSNADFVAGNVAGFVRTSQQQPGNSAQHSEEHNAFQYPAHQTQEGYQRSSLNSEPPLYNIQQSPPGSTVQQQQQQQQQQQPGFSGPGQVQADQQPLFPPSASSGPPVHRDRGWHQQGNALSAGTQSHHSLVSNELPMDNQRRFFKDLNLQPQVDAQRHQDYANLINYQAQSSVGSVNTNMPLHQGFNIGLQSHKPSQTFIPGHPQYNSRQLSEVPVPLGYNPPQGSHFPQIGGQLTRNIFEYPATIESSPRASVSSSGAPMSSKQQVASSGSGQQQASAARSSQSSLSKGLSRRRRATDRNVDHAMSGSYGDEEDDSDSQPITVVRPDGRPMNSGRVQRFQMARQSGLGPLLEQEERRLNGGQAAQSQRYTNHIDLNQGASDRYIASHGATRRMPIGNRRLAAAPFEMRPKLEAVSDDGVPIDTDEVYEPKQERKTVSRKKGSNAILETAGSGLMSKLLGTASTKDESEEEIDDDDDDPANEKRKEELEDAEFGIANEHASRHQNEIPYDGKLRRGSSLGGPGSADKEGPYAQRHQLRSDVEFYGHPAEETRQLKYGILGSGNYEVVNGGIYPEADESTAAVNSVANYVRKPNLLLPKLFAEHIREPMGPAQITFMPGGRMGGFMRATSPSPDGLLPASMGRDMSGSLLELVEANGGQLLDPSLLAQWAGSSARTTHASQSSDDDDSGEQGARKGDNKNSAIFRIKDKGSRTKLGESENELDGETRDNKVGSASIKGDGHSDERSGPQLQRQQSSISGSRSQGTNQFNSYQILPSKKVTIFSDQDLDSAPSEQWPSTGTRWIEAQ